MRPRVWLRHEYSCSKSRLLIFCARPWQDVRDIMVDSCPRRHHCARSLHSRLPLHLNLISQRPSRSNMVSFKVRSRHKDSESFTQVDLASLLLKSHEASPQPQRTETKPWSLVAQRGFLALIRKPQTPSLETQVSAFASLAKKALSKACRATNCAASVPAPGTHDGLGCRGGGWGQFKGSGQRLVVKRHDLGLVNLHT